jgi:hypothetical protein
VIENVIQGIVNMRAIRPPRPNDPIDYGRWKDEYKREPSREWIATLVRNAFSGFKVPEETEGDARRPFVTQDVAGQLLSCALSVPWLDAVIQENIARNKLKLPPQGDLYAYFRGTPLTKFFELTVSIKIPAELQYSGTYICGPPGAGKTVLLQHLVLKSLNTAAIILMDSKRDEDFIGMFRDTADIVLDPGPIAINPLSIPNTSPEALIDLNVYIFTGLAGIEYNPIQLVLLKYVLRCLIERYQNPTLMDLIEILDKGPRVKLDGELATFFNGEFNSKTYSVTKDAIKFRLRELLFYPVTKAIFSCKETKLDLRQEINARKFIIINANVAKLGDNASSFLQRLFMALILNAVRSGTNVPLHIFADECQTWCSHDKSLVSALDTLRAAKVACHLAHQRVKQMSPPVLDALSNCAITYARPEEDAGFFATKMRRSADDLRALPVGTWACYARGVGTFDAKIPLPKPPPKTLKGALFRRSMKQYYTEELTVPQPAPPQEAPRQPAPLHDTEMKPSKDW